VGDRVEPSVASGIGAQDLGHPQRPVVGGHADTHRCGGERFQQVEQHPLGVLAVRAAGFGALQVDDQLPHQPPDRHGGGRRPADRALRRVEVAHHRLPGGPVRWATPAGIHSARVGGSTQRSSPITPLGVHNSW
jgi:hypothetical protein